MVLELSTTHFGACWKANGQFCSITTPFQPLANPPSCVAALYARCSADITSQCSLQIKKTSNVHLPTQISPDVWILKIQLSIPASTVKLICLEKATETITIRKPLHILKLPTACRATLPNFYIPPKYQISNLEVNISLNMTNLHMINISALDFCIWQHLGDNRSEIQLQHLSTIPPIPVHKIYQHLIYDT